GCGSGRPASDTAPKMPHITAPSRPETEVGEAVEVVEVVEDVKVDTGRRRRNVRRARGAGAPPRAPRARRDSRRSRRTPWGRGSERVPRANTPPAAGENRARRGSGPDSRRGR